MTENIHQNQSRDGEFGSRAGMDMLEQMRAETLLATAPGPKHHEQKGFAMSLMPDTAIGAACPPVPVITCDCRSADNWFAVHRHLCQMVAENPDNPAWSALKAYAFTRFEFSFEVIS